MALIIYNLPNSGAADADYPQGSVLDEQTPGLLDGTQVKADLYNDYAGFFQRILDEAGITPSGDPDTVLASDYYDAIFEARLRRDIPIGSLIDHYGENPNSVTYAESGAIIDSSVVTGVKSVLPPELTLTQQTGAGSPTGNFEGAAFGNGKWVIVGYVGEIQNSVDRITWVQRTAANGYVGNFSNIYFGDGLHVALGASGEIQTSDDGGDSWSHQTAGASFTGVFQDGVHADGKHVIVGAGSTQTSADAVTWVQQDIISNNAIAYGGATFMRVGGGGIIGTSADAVTWTPRTAAGGYSGTFDGVAYNSVKERFILCGLATEIQSTDDNGVTMVQETAAATYSGDFRDAFYGDSIVLIVGSLGEVQASLDGKSWVRITAASSYAGIFFSCSVNDSGEFLAVGSGVEIQSADTTNRVVPTFSSLQVGFTQYMCIK